MRLRSLLLLGMAVALLFALGLLLGPATVLKFFGLTQGKTEVFLAQSIGTGLIGYGILSWFAKDFEPKALLGTTMALMIGAIVGFVVTLLAMLSQVTRTASGWLIVVIFFLFAAGLAYFQFMGPRE